MINQQRMIRQLTELVQIDSPSGREGAVARRLQEILTGLGMTVVVDDAGKTLGTETGNLIATLKGTTKGTPILFSAHMDTVQQPGESVKPIVTETLIKSDGTTILGSDDKAGITAFIEAIHALRENQIPHGDIQAVFTIWEEGGLFGSRHLDYSLVKAQRAFVLDSGGPLGTVNNQGPSQDSLEAVFHGKAAHAGVAPEAGISAIQMAARAIDRMKLLRIDEETTANLGLIEGGKATNIVTPRVRILGEARSLQEEKLAAQTGHMTAAMEAAANDFGGSVDVKVERIYSAFHVAEDTPMIRTLKDVFTAMGLTPVIQASGGGSDTNHFNANGIPAVNLSVGMDQVHTSEEFILIDDLVKAGEMVLALMKAHA